MIDFVGISPFLRIALRVAMETMHFFILLQDLKLTKHWFSSFQDVILAEGMN